MAIMKHIIRFLWIVLVLIHAGCYPASPVPATSAVDIQVSTKISLTETSTPACMEVPGVDIEVVPISANGITVKVRGLTPKEPVRIVFYSEFKGQGRRIECCP